MPDDDAHGDRRGNGRCAVTLPMTLPRHRRGPPRAHTPRRCGQAAVPCTCPVLTGACCRWTSSGGALRRAQPTALCWPRAAVPCWTSDAARAGWSRPWPPEAGPSWVSTSTPTPSGARTPMAGLPLSGRSSTGCPAKDTGVPPADGRQHRHGRRPRRAAHAAAAPAASRRHAHHRDRRRAAGPRRTPARPPPRRRPSPRPALGPCENVPEHLFVPLQRCVDGALSYQGTLQDSKARPICLRLRIPPTWGRYGGAVRAAARAGRRPPAAGRDGRSSPADCRAPPAASTCRCTAAPRERRSY